MPGDRPRWFAELDAVRPVTVTGYEYRNTVSADKRTNENLT
jgi:hypothetical protein